MATSPPPRCDFEATMATLGQKHVLGILHRLGERSPSRFHELRDGLQVNPRTLTVRLVELERLGVVARRVHHVVPRKVDYSLTPMGRDLVEIFQTLHAWKSKYSPNVPGARPPSTSSLSFRIPRAEPTRPVRG
ncbi:MAG: helix-turn-helix transcriptional regulator [Thermoplasmata archaeon]|nr:helix-turn-helix transcriptional regulator [Thermoplasmata archaeon]